MAVLRIAGAATGDLAELDTTSITGVSVVDRPNGRGKAYLADAGAISTSNSTIFGSVSGSPTTHYGHFRFSFDPSLYSDTTASSTSVRLWALFASATFLGGFFLRSYDDGNTSLPGIHELLFEDNGGTARAWTYLNPGTEYAVSYRLVINGASSTLDFYLNGKAICVGKTVACGTTSGLTTVNGFSRTATTLRGSVYLTDFAIDDANRYDSIRVVARQGRAGTPTHDAFTKTGGSTAAEVLSDSPVNTSSYVSSATSGAAQTMLVGRASKARSSADVRYVVSGDTILAARVMINAKTSATTGGGASASIRRIVNSSTTDEAISLTTSNAFYSTALFTATLAHLDGAEIGLLHGANTRTQTVHDAWLIIAYAEQTVPGYGLIGFAGAETGDGSELCERTLPSGVDASSSNAISGGASYRRSLATSGTVDNRLLLTAGAVTRAFINFRIKTDASVGSPGTTINVYPCTAWHPGGYVITGNTWCFYAVVVFATGGTVALRFFNRSNVQIGSDIAITEGTEYRVAIDWTGGAGATGTFKVHINGAATPSISVTNTDVGEVLAAISGLGKDGGTVAATYIYIDDYALFDDRLRYGVRVLSRGARVAGAIDSFTKTGGTNIQDVWADALGATGTYASSATANAGQFAWIEDGLTTQTGRGSQKFGDFHEIHGIRVALFGKTSAIASGGGAASIRRRIAGFYDDVSISLLATDRRHITGIETDYPYRGSNIRDLQIGILKGNTTETHTVYDMWALICASDPNDRPDQILFMAGAEPRDTSELTDAADYSQSRIETTSPITGGASFRIDTTVADNNLTYFGGIGDYTGQAYFSLRWKLDYDGNPGSNQAIRLFRAFNVAGTQGIYIRLVIDTAGNVALSVVNTSNTQVGTYTVGTRSDTSVHVMVAKITFGSGSGDGACEVWIDGTSRINVSSQNFNALDSVVGLSVDVTATGTKRVIIDDMVFGTKVVGPAGAAVPKVLTRPVESGTPIIDEWDKNGGSTIDAVWDNIPYLSTDFVDGLGASNAISQSGPVKAFDASATGFGSDVAAASDTILGAHLGIIAKRLDGTANTYSTSVWPIIFNAGRMIWCPLATFGTAGHGHQWPTFQPAGVAELNALDIGVLRRSGTHDIEVYGAWASIAVVSNNAIVSVTGIGATASVGTVTLVTDQILSVTGIGATSAVGTVTVSTAVNVSVDATGVSATAAVGTATHTATVSYAVTGISAAAAVGDESTVTDQILSVTGVSATAAVGTATVLTGIVVQVTGVSATASAGQATVPNNVFTVTGLAATAAVGTVSAGGILNVDLTASLGDVVIDGLVAAFGAAPDILARPTHQRIHLVEMYLGGSDPNSIFTDDEGGIGTRAILEFGDSEDGSLYSQVPYAIRISDTGWTGRYDDPDMANQYYDGRLMDPGSTIRNLPLIPEGERRVTAQVGRLQIVNADRTYDSLFDEYPPTGRKLKLLVGVPNWYYAEFITAMTLSIAEHVISEDIVTLTVRDRAANFDTDVQTTTFAGTGDAEGSANLKGAPKPLLYGRCLNVTPVDLGVTGQYIYQVHHGPIDAIEAIYDEMVALTPGTDYATFALLKASSPGAGTYNTCLAAGYFKVASRPAGRITADIRGDSSGAGYVQSPSRIAQRVLERYSGDEVIPIDTAAFDALHTARPWESGIYVTDKRSIADVASEILVSVQAWWGTTRDGSITTGYLDVPDEGGAVRQIDDADIVSIAEVGLSDTLYPPNLSRTVHYKRNWTPMREDEVAGSVSQTLRDFALKPHLQVTETTSALSKFPVRTTPPPVVTLLNSESDAQALAQHLFDLHGVERRAFRATIRGVGFSLFLGQTVLLQYSRLGLSGGRYVRIIGLEERLTDATVTVTVWG